MAHSNDEIRGVLIQAGEYRLLLPNATVAEVLTRAHVVPFVVFMVFMILLAALSRVVQVLGY